MKHSILAILRPVVAAVAAVAVLASCVKNDVGRQSEAAGDGTMVTIAFNPVTMGMPSAMTRTGYHGNPDDGELSDPMDATDLAVGNELDVAISEVRVLLYNDDTGKLAYDSDVISISGNDDPKLITVLTGTYDAVFIANEYSNESAEEPFLLDFLSDEENYDTMNELKNAMVESWAYMNDKNIPMLGVVNDVQIANNHTIILDSETIDTRDTPWSPELSRTGARISLEITFEPWQFQDWKDRAISLAGVPDRVSLFPGANNDSKREPSPRKYYTATAASNPASPAPVPGYDGYYWPVYASQTPTRGSQQVATVEKYIVRYDRIIVPELLFASISDATKAMELSLEVSGNILNAKVHASSASGLGYTLPRNTWLHLDATVHNSGLELNPIVVNWNTVATGDILADGKYTLEVDRELIVFNNGGGTEMFNITTNYPNVTIKTTMASPFSVTPNTINVPDGEMTTIPITVSVGTATSLTATDYTITAGKMRKVIRLRQIRNNSDDTPPTGVTTYVGAFWKASQTGERLIRIPRHESGSIDGRWSATVVEGRDWIVLDGMMTDDTNVGWREGADEEMVANGNDPGFDTTYPVHSNRSWVEGTVRPDDPDGIFFRIGLKSRYTPTVQAPARYGVVLLAYTNGSSVKLRRIWIRQGEGDDYLMYPTDVNSPPIPGHTAPIYRPLARKFPAYNLTAKAFMNGGTEWYYNIREWGDQTYASEPAFTNYPSQAGAMFRWAHAEGVRAYSPVGYTPFLMPGGVGVPWDEVDNVAGRPAGIVRENYEGCPAGYARPQDGITTTFLLSSSVNVEDSEMQQSLMLSAKSGGNSSGDPTNSTWGFYADGWFDRRKIGGIAAVGSGNATYYGTAVDTERPTAAIVGRLFFNPNSYNSLFLPAAGNINDGSTSSTVGRRNSGNMGLYYSASLRSASGTWTLTFTSDYVYRYNWANMSGYSIRCVVVPRPTPTIAPLSGSRD